MYIQAAFSDGRNLVHELIHWSRRSLLDKVSRFYTTTRQIGSLRINTDVRASRHRMRNTHERVTGFTHAHAERRLFCSVPWFSLLAGIILIPIQVSV